MQVTPHTHTEYTPLERRLLSAVERYKGRRAAAGEAPTSRDAWLVFLTTLATSTTPSRGRASPARVA
ncbi:MAG TPA: hypothetical protein VFX49_13580 [Chloroflexota bacterium]|nr:hypothetical protein [Chloroflexota bacterium]